MKTAFTGNEAVAYAVKQIKPSVIAAYPITPTTQIMEELTQYIADGDLRSQLILSESEHSAISSTLAASISGSRVFTATSSQGLALMHEILFVCSGLMAPIVMTVGARALSSPINIHNDHSDIMSERSTGWIQIFCETVQDAYDFTLFSYKLAENSKISLPIMVIMDGFITTHELTGIDLIEDSKINKFIGAFKKQSSLLNLKKPKTIGGFALAGPYNEVKEEQDRRIKNVLKLFNTFSKEFNKISKRKLKMIEIYNNNAKNVFVAQASICGTIRDSIKNNSKYGLVKINLFRPFPENKLKNILKTKKRIIVIDRANEFDGIGGPLGKEVKAALYGENIKIENHILGLGGKNISSYDIKKIQND